MKIVEPAPEPMFCWCVDFWIELSSWQNSIDPELLCKLFVVTVL